MAQMLAPLASSATDYKTSPTFDPPPTSFPYPERPKSAHNDSRQCSETTLHSGSHTQNPESTKEVGQDAGQNGNFERPRLASRKFDTEVISPTTSRTSAPLRQHRSTVNYPVSQNTEPRISSGESDTSFSSDEDNIAGMHRVKTYPAHNALSKSQLNRVRTHRRPSHLKVGNKFFQSQGRVARDGRLNISVNETAQTGYLAKALGATIRHQLGPDYQEEAKVADKAKADFLRDKHKLVIPSMNIVIMVIGSRGDIQPFLKIGKILKDKYHHRVRIASHPTFKQFVEKEVGLEFFSVGGDPSELMAFMVKNPGLIPTLETVRSGEIGKRRESMYQMFQGFWRACINATDDEMDVANLDLMRSKPPFVADAIIANPPSFAHYHCAERLSIPLHLVFTFPYSPTQAFPHPLANIKASNVDQRYTNFMSYPLVDLMTWQGLGDLINRFRVQTLGLEPVSTLWAPGQLSRLKVPVTYLWSPGLVPKPQDWGPEIDIAGYVFLDLATSYHPPKDLVKFLERSDARPIVYIGFGSISGISDPGAFTKMVFEAVEKAGVRAVVSRGWGGMGDGMDKPDGIFLIDNVPHDWLFPRVDAVVHHGGAGTTAAGLRFGKPTMIVPFFGDQPFWSAMVARAGAGAKEALPLKKLDSDKFAEGIRQCLEPEARAKAEAIAQSIQEEGDGAENAVDSFHRHLNLDGPHSMRCSIFPDRVAVWQTKYANTRLSALAANLLVESKQISWSSLELAKNHEWTDFQGPGEPITGAGGVLVQAFQEAFRGLMTMHETTKRDIKHYEKLRRRQKQKSAIEGLILPGRIALATRGTSVDEQRKEHARLMQQVNFHGEPEPMKLPFGQSGLDQANARDTSKLSKTTTMNPDRTDPMVVILKDVGKGIGHSSKAIAVLPLQMWNALALGFHNAPRLYGDKTVRPSPQGINGFRTGLKVAGKEFWFGLYDGVIGVVRIPYLDVQEDGMSALPKGIARGIGGLVLKPISGMLGLGAYTAKGVHSSVRRRVRDTQKTERWIQHARIAQGHREAQMLEEQRQQGSSELPQPHCPMLPDLAEARKHALHLWTMYEKDKMAEEREKEKRLLLLNKTRGEKT
ncbi:sterol 3beta-glucosyltransferase [Fonsecaea pedrosoi]|nr:sterol 3beta-glucosyltransferase [Fonsecaea pedrosoi]